MSSFFYGFIGFLFISGIIADKLSGKPVLILGLVMFSLATILTGVAGSLTSLIFYRVMTGIGEGSSGPPHRWKWPTLPPKNNARR
jgi:MFS family permease